MNKRTRDSLLKTAVLLAVLAAAVLCYYRIYLPGLKERESAGRIALFSGLVKEDITGLSIFYRDGTNVNYTELELKTNSWFMKKPSPGRANEETVLNILNDLSGIVSERVLKNEEGVSSHVYGFDRPPLRLTILESDSNILEMIAGACTPVGGMIYVMLKNRPDTVYLVYNYKFKSMERASDDFRDRGIFFINEGDIESIKIITKEKSSVIFQAVREEGGSWHIIRGYAGKNDDAHLKEKILSLLMLRIASFNAGQPDGQSLLKYGLYNPAYEITITGKHNSTNKLLVGSRLADGTYPALLPERNELIFIDQSDLDQRLNMYQDYQ